MNAPELDDIVWHKSSYSGNGAACIEVGWHKSSHSAGNGGCVEVASASGEVLVRDSKQMASPILTVTPTAWRALLAGII
ncbi:MAG: DUF397 domain-containing protein [Sciscionella sp.]